MSIGLGEHLQDLAQGQCTDAHVSHVASMCKPTYLFIVTFSVCTCVHACVCICDCMCVYMCVFIDLFISLLFLSLPAKG